MDPIRKKTGFYTWLIAAVLIILAIMPILFRIARVTKNPVEFAPQENKWVRVEARVNGILPELIPMIRPGDVCKDYNGEENIRVISTPKIVAQSIGKAVLPDGSAIEILSDRKDAFLELAMRYDMAGSYMVLHPTAAKLKIGMVIQLEFPEYFLVTEIVSIRKKAK